MITGCKTKTVFIPLKETSIEVVTLRDTVIKAEMAYYRDTIVTPDTISFLSNPYGFSWVEAKEGRLHHSLSSWPDSIIPVKIKYMEKIRIDSIPVPYTIEVPMYTEKPLSTWDKIRLRTGEVVMVAAILALLGWLVVRRKKY